MNRRCSSGHVFECSSVVMQSILGRLNHGQALPGGSNPQTAFDCGPRCGLHCFPVTPILWFWEDFASSFELCWDGSKGLKVAAHVAVSPCRGQWMLKNG